MNNGRITSLPIGNMNSFLTKQHEEPDAFFEGVATLTIESEGFSDDESVIKQVIDKDVTQVLRVLRE